MILGFRVPEFWLKTSVVNKIIVDVLGPLLPLKMFKKKLLQNECNKKTTYVIY